MKVPAQFFYRALRNELNFYLPTYGFFVTLCHKFDLTYLPYQRYVIIEWPLGPFLTKGRESNSENFYPNFKKGWQHLQRKNLKQSKIYFLLIIRPTINGSDNASAEIFGIIGLILGIFFSLLLISAFAEIFWHYRVLCWEIFRLHATNFKSFQILPIILIAVFLQIFHFWPDFDIFGIAQLGSRRFEQHLVKEIVLIDTNLKRYSR